MKSLLILGRQPSLGLAELESLYGAPAMTPIGKAGVVLDKKYDEVDFERLGGSIKLAEVLQTIGTTSWHEIEPHLESITTKIAGTLPSGKIKLGISTFGIRVRASDINRSGLTLKKALKSEGHSVRVVPNKFPELNSAQVLHNQLTGPNGIELVIARYDTKTIIARTRSEQDIEAYARRDQNRPLRDAKVGMLPPKLAQTIINLADNGLPAQIVLDPFCGTGVLMQEAILMGHSAYGTDVEPRMIEYSQKNLEWLNKGDFDLEIGDAMTHKWKPFDFVACETYLGKPFTSIPTLNVAESARAECDKIHEKFLQNIGSQLKKGQRLCLAVPAWSTKNGFLHLKTLAKLEQLGYTRKKFVHVRDSELIYHRPDQVVARELVVLEKN